MNTTTTSTRTSSFTSAWADIQHAQRRMTQLNRPWAAKRTTQNSAR